ncbi:MAG TPA: efflux RND transporter periplasmic adaptor subunit [Kofleriaceae bacterium]
MKPGRTNQRRDRNDDRRDNRDRPRSRRDNSDNANNGRHHNGDQRDDRNDRAKNHNGQRRDDGRDHAKPHDDHAKPHDNGHAKNQSGHNDERRADPRHKPPQQHEQRPRRERGGHDRDHGNEHGGSRKPSSKRAKLILFVVGIAAVVAMALFVVLLRHHHTKADADERKQREDALAQGPQITVATATKAPPTRTVVLPGDVRAWRLAVVYARVSGYLAELTVDRGDKVDKDQVLGRVTTPETELQLRPLQANLGTKRAIANRLRPLVPKGLVSQQDLDTADANVQQAQSDVDRLEALKGFEAIRAPFAGTVTQRYVDVGALMPAPTGSTQAAQPLVDIADLSRVRIVVYVGQRDATGIHVGDHASIVRDDDPTHPIAGEVTRIPTDLDLRTRTMWVEIDLDNPGGHFYPGLYVTVSLDVPAAEGVLIPSDAVALIDGKPEVALIKDGVAHFTKITIADDDGRTARVVAGVHVGDQISARISDELRDGGRVRAKPPQPDKDKRAGSAAGSAAGDKSTGAISGASTDEQNDAVQRANELKPAGSSAPPPTYPAGSGATTPTGTPPAAGSGAGGPT